MCVTARKIVIVGSVFLTFLLSACGGGGNSDVVVNKPGVALYTSAPETVNMSAGNSVTFKIGGGGNGSNFTSYSASSDTSGVASASVTSSDLIIQSVASGNAVVTVKDSAGASVAIKVIVSGSSGFNIQAPSTVTLTIGSPSSYKINGGSPPFNVVSSNLGVASGTVINGDSLLVTPIAAGGAQIAVYDSKGVSATLTSTVLAVGSPTALFTTSPSYISLSVDGSSPSFKLGGGTAPYSVISSSPDIIEPTMNQSGDGYSVKARSTGFGNIVIKDALGNSVTVVVAIVSGNNDVPFYTTATSSIVVKQDASSSFTVAGGKPPYSASSSDPSVANVKMTDTNVSISGVSPGSASIVVKDKVGSVVMISVGVPDPLSTQVSTPLYTSAPGSVILPNATTSTFIVAGGKAPYTATSSNQAVASSSMVNSTLSIKSLSTGTGSVVVTDSLGSKINIAVTVPVEGTSSVSNMFTTSPPSIILKSGVSTTYAITGGKAPYAVSSSAPAVATTSVSGSNFTINGIATGTASVVVLDANGTVVNIAVAVAGTSGKVSTPLFTTAPSAVIIKKGVSATYAIAGGSAPYTVTSNATAVVAATLNGSNFTLTGVGEGMATVVVVDSTGALISIAAAIN